MRTGWAALRLGGVHDNAKGRTGRSDDSSAGHLHGAGGQTFPDGTEALAGIDLSVAPGEFVSVVGPSGCGKSTMLRIAAGLTQPTEGSVSIPTDHICYVFQDPTLLPWRSVQANEEAHRSLKRHLANVVYSRLIADHRCRMRAC